MTFIEDSLGKKLELILHDIQLRIKYDTTYFGIKTLKNPLDNWVIQEIIFEKRPDVIIEIGNLNGGSTLNFAHFCDLIHNGKIIGIDISHLRIPSIVKNHPRITLIEGDACDKYDVVKNMIQEEDKVLIIEDSSHTYMNTLNILNKYSCLLRIGDYFIIEDSICNHGLNEGPNPGPYEAIETFLSKNKSFISDRTRESFVITWNPKGYLTKISNNNNGSIDDPVFEKNQFKLSIFKIIRILKLFIPPIVIILYNKINEKNRSLYFK